MFEKIFLVIAETVLSIKTTKLRIVFKKINLSGFFLYRIMLEIPYITKKTIREFGTDWNTISPNISYL